MNERDLQLLHDLRHLMYQYEACLEKGYNHTPPVHERVFEWWFQHELANHIDNLDYLKGLPF